MWYVQAWYGEFDNCAHAPADINTPLEKEVKCLIPLKQWSYKLAKRFSNRSPSV